MKIVTYNIQYGVGKDERLDLERIADELAGADIIGLQEVDRFWKRGGEVDQAETLAEMLADYYWVYASGMNVDASYRDDSGKLINRRRQHGDMVLSRYPILSTRSWPLPAKGSITRHSMHATLLEAVIDAPGGALRIYNVHLFYWSPDFALEQAKFVRMRILAAPLEGGSWNGDPAWMADHWTNGEQVPPMPDAAILLGDMNSAPASEVYDEFIGPVGMEGGRVQTLDRFVDPWTWLGNDEDSGATAHFGDHRIDHIWITPNLRDRIRAMHIDSSATGSDHKPVWLELDENANS
ncbi:MAG: endonuclease/exonuclease/phosphatase family protein [Geminicoccaceae bacterium]